MLLLRACSRAPGPIICGRVPFFPRRFFTHTISLPEKPLPPRLKIVEADLTISYLKGTGPGGQKIVCRHSTLPRPDELSADMLNISQNKTNSAVQISHGPSGIVVKCQATRSRSQNEKIARSLLADRIEHQDKGGEESRISLKAEAARKKKASKLKKTKRKYRSLDGAQQEGGNEEAEVAKDTQDQEVESEILENRSKSP